MNLQRFCSYFNLIGKTIISLIIVFNFYGQYKNVYKW